MTFIKIDENWLITGIFVTNTNSFSFKNTKLEKKAGSLKFYQKKKPLTLFSSFIQTKSIFLSGCSNMKFFYDLRKSRNIILSSSPFTKVTTPGLILFWFTMFENEQQTEKITKIYFVTWNIHCYQKSKWFHLFFLFLI